MKNIILTVALLTFSLTCFSQKNKAATKTASANKTTVGKSGNITAELLKKKDAYRFYLLLAGAKNKMDTLSLKTFAYDPKAPAASQSNNVPTNCVITPFSTKGIALHSISWTEKTFTEIPNKKEDVTRTITEIWDMAFKTQLYSNVQASTKITEILYLDKLKNASQTSEKMRNEGFHLTLSKDGDIVLKNKTQENKMVYDAAEKKYTPVKNLVPNQQPKKKK